MEDPNRIFQAEHSSAPKENRKFPDPVPIWAASDSLDSSRCFQRMRRNAMDTDLSPKWESPVETANRRIANRRNFVFQTAVAATLVAASIVGFDQFRDTAESVFPKTIQTKMAADFATLDAAYATLGRSQIEAFTSSPNEEIARRTIRWIQSRGHAGMYDLICGALMSPKSQVNLHAFNIIEKIDPIDLKPQESLISDCLKQTQNEFLKRNLPALLSAIESS
jgi:hypothetical protein